MILAAKLNAKNENITVKGANYDFLSFGTGKDVLIMLPGVGDGFRTAKGVALPFATMYRCFARDFKVYAFSRRNGLPEGFTTADMADDVNDMMEALGIDRAYVFGVSQGGMIAQQLAVRHPDRVAGLVLAVTAARNTPVMEEALGSWLDMADRDDYMGIMMDTAKRSYTGSYLKRGIRMNRLIGRFKPKDYTRFRILCQSCLTHDAYDELGKISCPVFIVGAGQDKVVGADASRELNKKIPGSSLYMYEGYSHGVYEQAKDFNNRVLRELNKQRLGF